MSSTLPLDVANLPPERWLPTAVEAFDRLAPGDFVSVTGPRDLAPLAREASAARRAELDWTLLASGRRHGVILRRRPASGARSVVEFLEWDHDRLDALFAEAKKQAGLGDVKVARERFDELAAGLLRHIEMEEQVLFPAFEAATGAAGPVRVMTMEHVEIKKLLEEAAAALDGADAPSFSDGAAQLEAILSEHNMKEEHVLYPATDRALDDARRDGLVRDMQALPA